jgi:hypothetical protein
MRLDEERSLKACSRASRPDVPVAGSCRPSRAYRHRSAGCRYSVDEVSHVEVLPVGVYLDPGESAVGTAVNVRHLAATPVGRLVTGEAEVTKVDGRQIDTFRATEGAKEIGAGSHSRVVIDVAKFMRRIE